VSLPVTEAAVAQILTVPCFPELTDDEVDRVCEALHGL
jgi:dTDP-3-amino-2,3,6-trideoxy-4-keto-D-glucose/dTDP-3-amino-3,4,6-trideoxy-alpha-D-glucose/dTDP-2,6-dideoxy-D-kanosamine transaminase